MPAIFKTRLLVFVTYTEISTGETITKYSASRLSKKFSLEMAVGRAHQLNPVLSKGTQLCCSCPWFSTPPVTATPV